MNLRGHAAYLAYVMRHKWHTFVECCKQGIPWRGLVHDLSKFRPSEWGPYVGHFFPDGRRGERRKEDPAFERAWCLHQRRNDHHWQWWVVPTHDGGCETRPMSHTARREMLADWRGSGKAQGRPDTRAWYRGHSRRMHLHPDTRAWVERQLGLTEDG